MLIFLNLDEYIRSTYLGYVKDFFLYFVKIVKIIYGEIFLFYNVYVFCYFVDDVENFGIILNEIFGFFFENYF